MTESVTHRLVFLSHKGWHNWTGDISVYNCSIYSASKLTIPKENNAISQLGTVKLEACLFVWKSALCGLHFVIGKVNGVGTFGNSDGKVPSYCYKVRQWMNRRKKIIDATRFRLD